MQATQTHASATVKAQDALQCGRVLVVDDDRAFGGFMLAALEQRGHNVDWAGCIADGLASLYACRYDLVIIDLRLPDGNGLEFLRSATDEGLVVDASAIILTGHDDFEEPDDIRVYRKPVDLDPFLDRVSDIVAATRRRRTQRSSPTRPPAAHRGLADDDGRRAPKVQKVELVLYTSAASEKCQRAIRSVREVLQHYDEAQVSLTICDLSGRPRGGEDDAIIFTPTLVKRGGPGPKTWIVGNLESSELLFDLLEVSGVDRKKGQS